MASSWLFWPTTTAATLSAIIWLAQSVALPASPVSLQIFTWIGRPPSPPPYWLIHFAVASETGVSMVWSTVGVLPFEMTPIVTGAPFATFFVPSTLLDWAPAAVIVPANPAPTTTTTVSSATMRARLRRLPRATIGIPPWYRAR